MLTMHHVGALFHDIITMGFQVNLKNEIAYLIGPYLDTNFASCIFS